MRTTSILTATAIALVAGLGSASAGEQLQTVDGLLPVIMSDDELDEVIGAGHATLTITPAGGPGVAVTLPDPSGHDLFFGFPGPGIGRSSSRGQDRAAAEFIIP